MKLKSSDSLLIVLLTFAVGLSLPTSAEAFPQTTKSTPAKYVISRPTDGAIQTDATTPSPLSGLDAKLEQPKYYSDVIPANKFVTYEVDLHEPLLGYSVANKCSTADAFLKLADKLGLSPIETLDKQSPVEAIPAQNAFYKPVGNNVYAISARQGFFNALQFTLISFRYGDKQIVVEVRVLEIPQSDVAMLQAFMVPGTFQVFGNQLPVVSSFASNGTFANQPDAKTNNTKTNNLEMNKLGQPDLAEGTFVRATETKTKAYPTFIGYVDEEGKQKLVELSKSRSAMKILQAPTVAMFPGQRAMVNASSLRPFVVAVDKVTDGTTTAHQPVVQLLEDGTTIALQAELRQDKLKLSGDLAFSKVLGVETFEYPSADSDDSAGIVIQVPEHRIRMLHWSADVTPNQSILIDSVETFEAEVKAKTRFKPAVTQTMRRLVMITPQIIEQKEIVT